MGRPKRTSPYDPTIPKRFKHNNSGRDSRALPSIPVRPLMWTNTTVPPPNYCHRPPPVGHVWGPPPPRTNLWCPPPQMLSHPQPLRGRTGPSSWTPAAVSWNTNHPPHYAAPPPARSENNSSQGWMYPSENWHSNNNASITDFNRAPAMHSRIPDCTDFNVSSLSRRYMGEVDSLHHAVPPCTMPSNDVLEPVSAVQSTMSLAPSGIDKLLTDLLASGLIHAGNVSFAAPAPTSSTHVPINMNQDSKVKTAPLEDVPDFTDFDTSKLRQRFNGVIDSLHKGFQCTTCGGRLRSDDMKTTYGEHLDWHFRENRRTWAGGADIRKRGWFQEAVNWNKSEDVKETKAQEAAEALFEEPGNSATGVVASTASINEYALTSSTLVRNPTASGGMDPDICAACHENFEHFWDDDADAWRLKDAVRYCGPAEGVDTDEKGIIAGKTYHGICFEDAFNPNNL